jgi:hypothetical protein
MRRLLHISWPSVDLLRRIFTPKSSEYGMRISRTLVLLIVCIVFLTAIASGQGHKAWCSVCSAEWGTCGHSGGGGGSSGGSSRRNRDNYVYVPSAADLERQRGEERKRQEEHARQMRQAQATSLNQKGVECERAGDFESAVAYYEAAKALEPADKIIAKNLEDSTIRLRATKRDERDREIAQKIRNQLAELIQSLPTFSNEAFPLAGNGAGQRGSVFNGSTALDQLYVANENAQGAKSAFANGNETLYAPSKTYGGSATFGQKPTQTTTAALNNNPATAHKQAGQPWDTRSSLGHTATAVRLSAEPLSLPAYLDQAPSDVKKDQRFRNILQERDGKVSKVAEFRTELQRIQSSYPRATVKERPQLDDKRERLSSEAEKLVKEIKADEREMGEILIEKITVHRRSPKAEPPSPSK